MFNKTTKKKQPTGYTIWKPLIICGNFPDIKNSENALVLFLEGFPDLKKQFFSSTEFWIKPNEEHFTHLESIINSKLEKLHKKESSNDKYKGKLLQMLLKAGHIQTYLFKEKQYTINTFSDRENKKLVDLIGFYDNLKDSQALGLKISPNYN